jgi:hypothetical protein
MRTLNPSRWRRRRPVGWASTDTYGFRSARTTRAVIAASSIVKWVWTDATTKSSFAST